MKRLAALSTFLLAAMLTIPGVQAGTEIVKCTGPDGQVTITDEVCPSGADTATLVQAAPAADAPRLSTAPTVERYILPRKPARTAVPLRTAPARGLALDVATLKAAHANLVLFDSAHSQARAVKLAGM
jgi:hypothetical protein